LFYTSGLFYKMYFVNSNVRLHVPWPGCTGPIVQIIIHLICPGLVLTRPLARWASPEASCGWLLIKENCWFLFYTLPYKLFIWAGPIAHLGHSLFKSWLEACYWHEFSLNFAVRISLHIFYLPVSKLNGFKLQENIYLTMKATLIY